MTSDAAVMGPEIRCQEEPKRAATTTGTIAAKRPYSGGIPAIVANATPCGKTTIAPVKPANTWAFSVRLLTSGNHCRNEKTGYYRTFFTTESFYIIRFFSTDCTLFPETKLQLFISILGFSYILVVK